MKRYRHGNQNALIKKFYSPNHKENINFHDQQRLTNNSMFKERHDVAMQPLERERDRERKNIKDVRTGKK